jgi:hypothetical protein
MKSLLLSGALFAATLVPLSTVSAHEAPCPYCSKPITQDTATQDNEVALKYGRKRIEYKCVYCALAEAKTEYPNGDLSILAPSEKKGEPVILKRNGGKWAATPASAVFVSNSPLKHKACDAQARAFTTEAAAKAYIAKTGLDTSPLTLAQMLERAK